jgi:hypothetical protein
MAYETKPNAGSLFKVEGEKGETWHDDYKGSALIDGKEYWCGLAKKTSKAGMVYLALTFRPKTEAAEPKPEIEDTIPFLQPRVAPGPTSSTSSA